MTIKPGDLVVYTEFEAARRGRPNRAMLVIERVTRLKREGAYYRILDGGTETLCHGTHIRRLRCNENISLLTTKETHSKDI